MNMTVCLQHVIPKLARSLPSAKHNYRPNVNLYLN
jgi:hypothetical protein